MAAKAVNMAVMHRFLLVCSLWLSACSGTTPSQSPDAASGPAPRTFGAQCATPSNTAADCDSGVCTDTIDKAGHDVCSQLCTIKMMTDTSCPTGSMGQFCNGKGYCKP
jgi:hypothetical protein